MAKKPKRRVPADRRVVVARQRFFQTGVGDCKKGDVIAVEQVVRGLPITSNANAETLRFMRLVVRPSLALARRILKRRLKHVSLGSF